MIDTIIVNKDKTEARIYFTDGRSFGLSHDKGQVLDLVAWFTTPHTTSQDITWNGLITSQEDTVIIPVTDVA